MTATTDAEAERLREAGTDYVVLERELVGAEFETVLELLDDPEAFERRLEALNDRVSEHERPVDTVATDDSESSGDPTDRGGQSEPTDRVDTDEPTDSDGENDV